MTYKRQKYNTSLINSLLRLSAVLFCLCSFSTYSYAIRVYAQLFLQDSKTGEKASFRIDFQSDFLREIINLLEAQGYQINLEARHIHLAMKGPDSHIDPSRIDHGYPYILGENYLVIHGNVQETEVLISTQTRQEPHNPVSAPTFFSTKEKEISQLSSLIRGFNPEQKLFIHSVRHDAGTIYITNPPEKTDLPRLFNLVPVSSDQVSWALQISAIPEGYPKMPAKSQNKELVSVSKVTATMIENPEIFGAPEWSQLKEYWRKSSHRAPAVAEKPWAELLRQFYENIQQKQPSRTPIFQATFEHKQRIKDHLLTLEKNQFVELAYMAGVTWNSIDKFLTNENDSFIRDELYERSPDFLKEVLKQVGRRDKADKIPAASECVDYQQQLDEIVSKQPAMKGNELISRTRIRQFNNQCSTEISRALFLVNHIVPQKFHDRIISSHTAYIQIFEIMKDKGSMALSEMSSIFEKFNKQGLPSPHQVILDYHNLLRWRQKQPQPTTTRTPPSLAGSTTAPLAQGLLPHTVSTPLHSWPTTYPGSSGSSSQDHSMSPVSPPRSLAAASPAKFSQKHPAFTTFMTLVPVLDNGEESAHQLVEATPIDDSQLSFEAPYSIHKHGAKVTIRKWEKGEKIYIEHEKEIQKILREASKQVPLPIFVSPSLGYVMNASESESIGVFLPPLTSSLHSKVKTSPSLTLKQITSVLLGIAEGIEWLHNNSIALSAFTDSNVMITHLNMRDIWLNTSNHPVCTSWLYAGSIGISNYRTILSAYDQPVMLTMRQIDLLEFGRLIIEVIQKEAQPSAQIALKAGSLMYRDGEEFEYLHAPEVAVEKRLYKQGVNLLKTPETSNIQSVIQELNYILNACESIGSEQMGSAGGQYSLQVPRTRPQHGHYSSQASISPPSSLSPHSSAPSSLEGLKDSLTCSICFNLLADPVHFKLASGGASTQAYCRTCASNHIQTAKKRRGPTTNPILDPCDNVEIVISEDDSLARSMQPASQIANLVQLISSISSLTKN